MPSNPHDVLVKKTFSIVENAEGELRAILPAEVCARIDWSTLKLEPGSFVDADAREWHTDLLFSANIAEQRVLLYFLLEHQSTVYRWMPKRMLTYMDKIWTARLEEGAQKLPIILPLVLHHSERGWTAGRHMHDLFDASAELLELVGPYVPSFEILIDDLGHVPEAELLRRPMTPMARITLWALRALRLGHDPELIASWTSELEHAQASAEREAFEVFFVYLGEVEGGEALIDAILGSKVDDKVREVVMGVRKRWEDEAEARGRAEGEARGRAEAMLKLLQLRFTALPQGAVQRVRAASAEELDRWIERVLSAEQLDDIWG